MAPRERKHLRIENSPRRSARDAKQSIPQTPSTVKSCGLTLDEKQAIMRALDFEEKMKKELESIKEMIFSYVRAFVRVMILEDPPEKARKIFSKNPDLLKEYIKKREGNFLAEYCRMKNLDLERFLEKETEKILNDDERYRRIILSIIRIDEDREASE